LNGHPRPPTTLPRSTPRLNTNAVESAYLGQTGRYANEFRGELVAPPLAI
jgi:hypothetical protein